MRPSMAPEDDMHQIGEVADAVGLSLRTIRHYEETGLAPPSGRTAGGFRLYTDADIARLRLIKQMKPLDFSLEELRAVLEARDRLSEGSARGGERRVLQERVATFAATAEQRCARLRQQLDAADALVGMLRHESRGAR